MNYFELYPGDYLRDTGELSLAQHGAYLLLMASYYSTEDGLPADRLSLCRITRAMTKAEQADTMFVADRFFTLGEDGRLHSARIDEDIQKAHARIDAARVNGSKGGRPKKPRANPDETQQKPSGFQSGFDPHNPDETQKKAHQTPYTNNSVGSSSTHTGDLEGRDPSGGGVCAESTREVQACVELRKRGFRLTPQNPDLIAAIAEGVTVPALIAMADSYPGKPAGYVISACRRQLAEAASPPASARAGPNVKPPIAQQFAQKTYRGTPDDQLPAHLRSDAP